MSGDCLKLSFYNQMFETPEDFDPRIHMTNAQPTKDWGSLDAEEIDELNRILSQCMPGRVKNAKGPKGQGNPFRSCISCMLSAFKFY